MHCYLTICNFANCDTLLRIMHQGTEELRSVMWKNGGKNNQLLNVGCFLLAPFSLLVSGGDYFLPLAVFGIAAFTGLFSPSYKRKMAAFSILAGFICFIVVFVPVVIWTSDLTLAPPSQWFSGN